MVEAVARLEEAETQGVFSELWRDPLPLPERPGWVHSVSNGRDKWLAVLDHPRMALSVVILPPTARAPGCRQPCMSFVASVDGEVLVENDLSGTFSGGENWERPIIFSDPLDAMCAAEGGIPGDARMLGETSMLLPLVYDEDRGALVRPSQILSRTYAGPHDVL
jgi:hypothetical protein